MWRRQLGHMRESDDHSSRSAGCSCGRRRFRVSTSMWCRSAMFSSASSRRSRATALTAASAYLKTSHIDASRHAGSVRLPSRSRQTERGSIIWHCTGRVITASEVSKKPGAVHWDAVPYCEITAEDLEKYRLSKGDALIARMADPGHGCVIEEERDAVFASYLIRFRPIHDRYGRLLQYWLRSDAYWQLVRERGAGTTRRSLNAKVLSDFPLVVPPSALLDNFGSKVEKLRSRIVTNTTESSTLAAQRDALLPRLVSGRISTL